MAKPLPPLDVPVLTPNGLMNQAWFEYFQGLQSSVGGLLNTASFVVPPVTPGNTSASVSSISRVASTDPVGSVLPIISYDKDSIGTTFNQDFANAYTSIADSLTKASTNDGNLAAAVTALNTRVRAIENTLDAAITDLAARFP